MLSWDMAPIALSKSICQICKAVCLIVSVASKGNVTVDSKEFSGWALDGGRRELQPTAIYGLSSRWLAERTPANGQGGSLLLTLSHLYTLQKTAILFRPFLSSP